MERYSKAQSKLLKALNNQVEARLTRTKSVALVNELRQKRHMRNYQSGYDRIRNELSTYALPFQTQEGINNRNLELDKMGTKLYNIIAYT